MWAWFIASFNVTTVAQLGFTIYALDQYLRTESGTKERASEWFGGGLYLTLCIALVLVLLLIFIAVGDLGRLHLVLAFRQWRLNVAMKELVHRLHALEEGSEKGQHVLMLAEKGMKYVSTYTYNNFQYDNKLLLLKIAEKWNHLMLMRADTAREKLKCCVTALYQNSRAKQRNQLAAESEAIFAASPMIFFQGTEIGGHDDFERFLGAPEADRGRAISAPITTRYHRLTEPSTAHEPRKSDMYATVGSRQSSRSSWQSYSGMPRTQLVEPMGLSQRLLRNPADSSADSADFYFTPDRSDEGAAGRRMSADGAV